MVSITFFFFFFLLVTRQGGGSLPPLPPPVGTLLGPGIQRCSYGTWGPRGRAPKGQNHAHFKVTSSDPEVEHSSYVVFKYCMSWNFRGGFIFSRVKPSRKFPLQFMSIYSNDNISKIVKLTPRELPHLAKTAKITVRENNGVYSTFLCEELKLFMAVPRVAPMGPGGGGGGG